MKPRYVVVSFSGGKDSTAMLLRMMKICDRSGDSCTGCGLFFAHADVRIDPKDIISERTRKVPRRYCEVEE